jgi:hypothetical protein
MAITGLIPEFFCSLLLTMDNYCVIDKSHSKPTPKPTNAQRTFQPMHFQPMRSVNRISDDFCAINQQERESQKPLKFVTTSFKDFNDRNELRGIYFQDGFGVPGSNIDTSNMLHNGQINTTQNLPQSLPAFPLPTTGSKVSGQGQGDTDVEFSLRGKDTNGKKTCLPIDPLFHDRSFSIFDSLCRKPQNLKHTVQHSHGFRGGISTRNFNC